MKKFLIGLNVFLLLIIFWQNWRIDDIENFSEMRLKDSEFWHGKYIHQKIHGDN